VNEVLKVATEDTTRVLHLAGRGSSDVNFCKRTDERDGMEGVTDPYHRETVGKFRNKMWCVGTLELNALVEIIDGFSEPQTDYQERGETCESISVRGCKDRYFDGVPIMKPKIPIQAHTRWTIGLSSVAPNLAPSLARKAIRVKRMKKMDENPRAMAMKAGVVDVGADNQRDMSPGSTERSRWGMRSGCECALRQSWTYRNWDSERE